MPTQVYISVGAEETFVAAGRNPFSHFSRIESAAGADKLSKGYSFMASAIWKSSITFGLVSIPIRLYAAARPRRIALRRLHSKCEAAVGPPLRSGRLLAAS